MRQKLEIKNQINKQLVYAQQLRSQSYEIMDSVNSRQKVFEQKLQSYIEGLESCDNLIQARKNLLDSQQELAEVLGDFYGSISHLDRACGVYFKQLGITIPPEYATIQPLD
jgi:outer membrane protein TolC